ncbi:MAG: diacylglycerol/lipid kinase family protein [Candidatus Dormibacteria bacterium]
MSQPRTLVIVNPASAGGRTAARWPRLRDALHSRGVAHDVHHTTAPGEATRVTAQALADGWERIVAAGGDGTLNEVVNGYFTETGAPRHPEASIGLLPSGTGGDFRRSAGIPTEPALLASLLELGTTRLIDAGRIVYDDPATPPRMFINIADCGVGGEVVARVNRSAAKAGGVRGTAVFLGISVLTLATYPGRRVRLVIDGSHSGQSVQNVVVANGRCFGGGMRIAPHAELDDGLFDVVVLPALGRTRTLMAMPSVYSGRHIRQPGVRVERAAQVRIEPLDGGGPILFDVEGEQVGAAPATLTVVPRSIRLLAP